MAKTKKTTFKAYFAWNYETELADLNRASEQGWQLVKAGAYHSKFAKDDSLRYRYQIDSRFLNGLDEKARYLDTFREQGWEYINSTFNGWHFFRKPYDPALPESAYEIFTDRESLQEMNKPWAKLFLIFALVIGLGAVYYFIELLLRPCLPTLIYLLTMTAESAVLLYGGLQMRRIDSQRRRRGRGRATVFVALLLAGFISGFVLQTQRARMSVGMGAGSIGAKHRGLTQEAYPEAEQVYNVGWQSKPFSEEYFNEFQVKYADYYYLDLHLESDAPIHFSIVSQTGEVLYTQTSADFHEENIRLLLTAGSYGFSMTSNSDSFFMDSKLR